MLEPWRGAIQVQVRGARSATGQGRLGTSKECKQALCNRNIGQRARRLVKPTCPAARYETRVPGQWQNTCVLGVPNSNAFGVHQT